ncbi:hypothetical protein IGI49_004573 [Enterococcus sp. AZ071]
MVVLKTIKQRLETVSIQLDKGIKANLALNTT